MPRKAKFHGEFVDAEGGSKFRRRPRRMNPKMEPDLAEAFEEVLHPEYERQLLAAASRLRAAGIPFVLAGGIATGAYGEPRGTKDIDLMLPLKCWTPDNSTILVAPIDVLDLPKIDLIVMPQGIDALETLAMDSARTWKNIQVLAPEVLAVMKLEAWRPQDRADIASLIEAGLDPGAIREALTVLPSVDQARLEDRLTRVLMEREEAEQAKLKRKLI